MSKLTVHSVGGKGDLATECVWLDVLEDIANLSDYALCDTTYIKPDRISNELRHIYWFRRLPAKKGDWIKLMTKEGNASTAPNNRNTRTHIFYWGLGRTVWNKDGDGAILFTLASWSTLRV